MLLFDVVYLIFLLLALPIWVKFLLKKEYRKILKHRLSPGINYSKEKRIWIHAVSVGEVRSLKYLVEQLKEKYKKKEIVLSVTTPAGFECAQKEYPDIPVINAPVDFSFTIKRFIKKINPQLVVLNELEIWPNWVLITRRKNIPMLLINGRISDLAFKRYKKGLFLLKFFLRGLIDTWYRQNFTKSDSGNYISPGKKSRFVVILRQTKHAKAGITCHPNKIYWNF